VSGLVLLQVLPEEGILLVYNYQGGSWPLLGKARKAFKCTSVETLDSRQSLSLVGWVERQRNPTEAGC